VEYLFVGSDGFALVDEGRVLEIDVELRLHELEEDGRLKGQLLTAVEQDGVHRPHLYLLHPSHEPLAVYLQELL
jgi:hypothetical protein